VIVSLLILVVLILLFGAATLKGWLANVIGAAFGLALLIAAGIWVNTYFGDYGLVFVCIALLLLLAGAWAYVKSDLP
jgi:hypothetical protein